MAEIEIVLHKIQTNRPESSKIWAKPLHLANEYRQQPELVDKFWANLQSNSWIERFAARYALVQVGGEIASQLQIIADDKPKLEKVSVRLLKNIGWETTAIFASKTSSLVCPHCFTLHSIHKIQLPKESSVTLYGCRTCQQSRDFLDCP